MSHDIDNWYRQQVNNQNIPEYREEYWQTAQAYIAKQNRLRKIKTWGSLLVVLIVLFLGGLILFKNQQNYSFANSSEIDKIQVSEQNNFDNSIDKKSALNSGSSPINTSIAIKNDWEVNKKTSTTDIIADNASHIKKIKTGDAHNIQNTNHLLPIEDENLAYQDGNRTILNPSNILEKEIKKVPTHLSHLEKVNTLTRKDWLPIKSLNTDQLALSILDPGTTSSSITRRQPTLKTGIHLGVPFHVDTDRSDLSHAGFDLGFFAQYRLNPGISIESGLTYWQRKGPVGIIHDSPTSIYHFEKIDQGYWMEIDELHYLSIPVMVNWHMDKITIGAGVSVWGLINAKAVVSKYRHDWISAEEGLVPHTVIESSQSGYTRSEGLERFNFNIRGQMNYQLSRHWEVGVQVDYLPQGFTNENFGRRYHQIEDNFRNSYKADRPFVDHALFSAITLRYLW